MLKNNLKYFYSIFKGMLPKVAVFLHRGRIFMTAEYYTHFMTGGSPLKVPQYAFETRVIHHPIPRNTDRVR